MKDNSATALDEQTLTETQKAALKALIAKKKEMAQSKPEARIPVIDTDPANKDEPFPLTDIQQAQWFGRSGLFDISVAGHGYVEFDCKGKDLDRLEAAFQTIIDRHPQMRMVVLPDLTQQVLTDLPPYEFQRFDMRGKSQEEVDTCLNETRERMSHDIIPADVWPIYEVCATQWDEDELRVHFSFDLLVGDAWCFRMIIDEWAKIYENPDDMRKVPTDLTYRDYVLGFEKIEESDLFKDSLKYWQEHMSALPSAPELPMIKQPADLTEIRAEHYSIRFTGEEWAQLQQRIRRNQLTPSAFFAAAFSEIITLWNSNPQHTLNVTVFNRLPVHPEINDILVGEFNSFLLLGVDNAGTESFATRAKKSQAKLWSHLENRWVTGVRLMRELTKVQGVATGDALMPVVFTSTIAHHEGESDIPTQSPGDWIYEISQTPQVWMEHHLWEEADALSLHIDVVQGLFPDGLIQDFVDTYEKLLHSLLEDDGAWDNPNARHLLPKQYDAMWANYNKTDAVLAKGLLHTGFCKAAKDFADKTAIVSSRGNKTYAELDLLSNQIGHCLKSTGIKPNDLVAVIAPKGWEQLAGVIGAMKSGGAYLPIEADYPAERINQILQDAGVTQVLTTADVLAQLSLPDGVSAIIVGAKDLANQPKTLPKVATTEDDIAYVIYTSGSTGKPKGVVIRHSAAQNTCADINDRFDVSDTDVIFAISALNFDLSVYDIFGGLGAGATLVMPSTQHPEPLEWLTLAEEYQITIWNSVPALAELFVSYAEETGRFVPDSLRLTMLSGDWIPLSLPPMLEMVRPDMQIISLGGATEAAIWSIYYPIQAIAPDWKSIPYGMPLANQTMHILNHELQHCPPWATGEICIGGAGVADGYFGDAEKTAASFVLHPQTKERLYRTGDLGRFNPDGHIEFLGRKDTQVKLRGYRIELGEIENSLMSSGLVGQAACLITGESNESRQLVAFVTQKIEGCEDAFSDQLREALKNHLPDYMVPHNFLVLDSLPVTANGKVDRKQLATMADGLGQTYEYIAPRNDTEKRIAEIWQGLLDVEQVGVLDDFFALGGNSMIASRLIIQIQEVFDVELPFSKLFDAANVAAISDLVIAEILAEIEALEDA